MSEEYEKFLNWCEDKWTQEHKMQKLLSKLSNDDIDFLKEQYENRLKADLKAILVEIQLQMAEYEPKWVENDEQAVASCRTWEDLDRIIQNKINELKAESEDKA